MKFNEEVETVTRQKEMLEAKMKVHDDLGRVLLALRTYLEEPENSKRRKGTSCNVEICCKFDDL